MTETKISQKKERGPALQWFQANWIILLLCLASILLCMVFYMNTAIVAQRINENANAQFSAKCQIPGQEYVPTNITERFPVFNLSNWRAG